MYCTNFTKHLSQFGLKAAKYAYDVGGLMSADEYPYIGEKGICNFNKSKIQYKPNGYADMAKNSTNALKGAIYKSGPIPVGIYLTQKMFDYQGGQ